MEIESFSMLLAIGFIIFCAMLPFFQRRKVFVYTTSTGERRTVTATRYLVKRQALVFFNKHSVVCRAARGQWSSVEIIG
jgi:hypothetical protein